MTHSNLQIRRLAAGLGAAVHGLDIAQGLSDEQVRAIHDAWLEHLVLVFPGQPVSAEVLIVFSRHFGDLETHETYQPELRHPDHPELLVVRSKTVGGKKITFGQQWHSDLSYTLRPAKGSVLLADTLPPVGGDTAFTNNYLAYETLSRRMRDLIDPLWVVHDLTNGRSHRADQSDRKAATLRRNPPVEQPLVRTHPETGRKALFVSEWMCNRIVGMTEAESHGLLRFLFDHQVQPEFIYRHRWRPGDLVMWDNRCTNHVALRDYDPSATRVLLRTSLIGTPSGRPCGTGIAEMEEDPS